MSAKEKGQAGMNSTGPGMTTFSRLPGYSTAPVDLILSRLENVRPYGKGNRCDCPNGHRSKGTLSVTAGEDGQVLLHCFAGCEPLDIVHAIGLELTDLFPARITANLSPAQRRELRQQARQSQWAAALNVLEREARIIQIAGQQIAGGIPLDGADGERLDQAVDKIESARLVLNG